MPSDVTKPAKKGCRLTVEELSEAVHGQILSKVAPGFVGVSTDTREDLAGRLYIPLKGEKFDGHHFLGAAQQGGAAVLLVDHETEVLEGLKKNISVVKVPDTLRALQDLARLWRRRLFRTKIVAITGSSGKSTTKDFCQAILAPSKKVYAAKKSFNNHIGVPLTLLGVSTDDEVALVEMGMNHAKELANLSKIAEPDLVLCTMVGKAHIGNFGGSQQAVADAKEEIYLSNPKAVKVFNYDNEYTLKMFERVSKLTGTDNNHAFSSFAAGAEVSLRATHMNLESMQVIGHIGGIKGEANVPVFGRQNVTNLMAAATVAFSLGVEPEKIWAALPECRAGWGRNQLMTLKDGAKVVFDAYNANPDSMAMLIKNIFEIYVEGGKKVAVLGEMLELGADAGKYHHALGELVGNVDFEVVWFLGSSQAEFAAGLRSTGFSKTSMFSYAYEESIALKVGTMLHPSDVVVIKGSRGMHLEKVLQAWDSSLGGKI